MNDQQVEARLKELGKDGLRVTAAHIESLIVAEHYFTAIDGATAALARMVIHRSSESTAALRSLTFCVLVLANGFTVTGESACADPTNFDRELGQKLARQNAFNKVWPLEGYLLRELIHQSRGAE